MIKLLLITFISFSSVYPQTEISLSTDKIQYRLAMENPESKSSCATFKTLSNKKEFKVKSIAKLRHVEYCEKNPNWNKLSKEINDPNLKPFFIRIQFKHLMDHKKYKQAYRLYIKNTRTIELDNRDFDKLATKALKTSLSKKEKRALRKKLYKKSPRFIPRPQKSEYLRVAKDFRKDRRFEKALSYYKKVINGKGFTYHQRWYAFQGARMTYKIERWTRMKKYIRASKQWSEFLKDKYKWSAELTRMHHDANIEYIRTLWTEKGQKQAFPVLSKLEKQLKKRYSMQMVYWLKGRMAEEKRNYKEAVKWLHLASKEKSISSDNEQKVLWSLAWNKRRIGKHKESQSSLKKLKKHRDLAFFGKTKYLYWEAENFESMGEKSKAQEAFEDLADLDIVGYYGSLALRKLGKKFPKPPKRDVTPDDYMSFFNAKDKDYLQWLIDVEESEIAENFVKRNLKTKNSWSTSKWVNYLVLLQEVGAYKSFFYRYHSLPPKKQVSILKEHSYLLFPRPFKKHVRVAAQQSQVSPSLIYSIMKQESGFDIKARSWADAFGLLQLIPQVAKKAAKRVPSVGYKKPEDLYRPNVIIPLGADTIKHLLSKFKNNFILSVASYNASEKATLGWVKSRFHGDPITFIEDIPYDETKSYVKLVMRNYIAYNRFESESEDFTFPEVCLDGLQHFKK